MDKILGSKIELATDDDRARTILFSDLHLGQDTSQALAWFSQLLAQAATQATSTRVVILGDLFDAYTGPKQARVQAWAQVVQELRRTAAAGVSVSLLQGNRDYMLDSKFAEMSGCRVVEGGLRIRLGERQCLLLHGDELCQNDLPYQKSKRYLRHPVTKALLRNLPLGVALHLAGKVRMRSKKSIVSGDQERFWPVEWALRQVFAGQQDMLIFGHIHHATRGQLADAGEFVVLPAFDEAGVHLMHTDGELYYRNLEGQRLPDFPPRQFS